jgi:hypothetical protein
MGGKTVVQSGAEQARSVHGDMTSLVTPTSLLLGINCWTCVETAMRMSVGCPFRSSNLPTLEKVETWLRQWRVAAIWGIGC